MRNYSEKSLQETLQMSYLWAGSVESRNDSRIKKILKLKEPGVFFRFLSCGNFPDTVSFTGYTERQRWKINWYPGCFHPHDREMKEDGSRWRRWKKMEVDEKGNWRRKPTSGPIPMYTGSSSAHTPMSLTIFGCWYCLSMSASARNFCLAISETDSLQSFTATSMLEGFRDPLMTSPKCPCPSFFPSWMLQCFNSHLSLAGLSTGVTRMACDFLVTGIWLSMWCFRSSWTLGNEASSNLTRPCDGERAKYGTLSGLLRGSR